MFNIKKRAAGAIFLLIFTSSFLQAAESNGILFILPQEVEDAVVSGQSDGGDETSDQPDAAAAVIDEPEADLPSEAPADSAEETGEAADSSVPIVLLTAQEREALIAELWSGLEYASSALVGSGKLGRFSRYTPEQLQLLIEYRNWVLAVEQSAAEATGDPEEDAPEVDDSSGAGESVPGEGDSSDGEQQESAVPDEDSEADSVAADDAAKSVQAPESTPESDPEDGKPEESAEEGESSVDAGEKPPVLQVSLMNEERRLAAEKLLLEHEEGFSDLLSTSLFFFILKEIQVKEQMSLNRYHYREYRFRLEAVTFSSAGMVRDPFEVAVVGFDPDPQAAFDQALSSVEKQLLAALAGVKSAGASSSVVEVIDSDEVVVNIGSDAGAIRGSTFSVIKFRADEEGHREADLVGQLIAYEVAEKHSYCEIVYLTEEELIVGDHVELDPRAGVSFSLRTEFLGSLNRLGDLSTGELADNDAQSAGYTSYFGEFAGSVGARFRVDYGTYLLKPFFGLDLMIDGPDGWRNAAGNHTSQQLYSLGVENGKAFKNYKTFNRILRPYIGAEMNWHLNRVTLAPQLALGMVLGEPYRATSASTPVPYSAFHYFTVDSGIDVKVHLSSRFTFDVLLGYQFWLGNNLSLKKDFAKSAEILKDDFLKYFDWQFLRAGVGFTVHF